MSKATVVSILVGRDGLCEAEAKDRVAEVEEFIWEAIDNGEDPSEVLLDELQLEPDYLEGWIF